MSVPATAHPPLTPAEACAQAVLTQVPLLMRELRAAMRQSAPDGLGVPQFRALLFAHREPGAGVSALAAHLGVTLPTASAAVATLAERGLLTVQADPSDRRRRALALTPAGEALVRSAWQKTAAGFARRLGTLGDPSLRTAADALRVLADCLTSPPHSP